MPSRRARPTPRPHGRPGGTRVDRELWPPRGPSPIRRTCRCRCASFTDPFGSCVEGCPLRRARAGPKDPWSSRPRSIRQGTTWYRGKRGGHRELDHAHHPREQKAASAQGPLVRFAVRSKLGDTAPTGPASPATRTTAPRSGACSPPDGSPATSSRRQRSGDGWKGPLPGPCDPNAGRRRGMIHWSRSPWGIPSMLRTVGGSPCGRYGSTTRSQTTACAGRKASQAFGISGRPGSLLCVASTRMSGASQAGAHIGTSADRLRPTTVTSTPGNPRAVSVALRSTDPYFVAASMACLPDRAGPEDRDGDRTARRIRQLRVGP